MYVSITRFEIKSLFQLPRFIGHANRSFKQVLVAPGLIHADRSGQRFVYFWTLTAWESKQHMQNYLGSGDHLKAMQKAGEIAKSLDSFGYETDNIPSWKEARQLLLKQENTSKIHNY